MSLSLSAILKPIISETAHRCNELLEQVSVITRNTYTTSLAEEIEGILNDLKKKINSLQKDEAISDSRIAANYAIKLSSIIVTIHDIQDGPLTALIGFDKLDQRLNRIVSIALEEIDFPYLSPVISTSGRIHFACFPKWNLIFAPPNTGFLLTSIPDLFHELGHMIWNYNKRELESTLLMNINNHISSQLREAEMRHRAEAIGSDLRNLKPLWRDWIKELFSDIFSVYVTGPAYANSHLRYCIENIAEHFRPGKLGDSFEHPSDAIRLDVITKVLAYLGLDSDAKQISIRWSNYVENLNIHPPTENDILYPPEIIREIVSLSCEKLESFGFKRFQIDLMSSETLTLIQAMNESWEKLACIIPDYPDWERSVISALVEK